MEWGRREEGPNQGAPGDAPPGAEPPAGPAAETEPPRRWASRPDEGSTGGGPSGAEAGPLTAPPASADDDPFAERPELLVGAAFVGGFALAQIMKRLGP